MARPQKDGLDYFPLDVDIDADERVEYILARYGFQAFGILVKVLMEIYRQGYYMMWTERQQYLLSRKLNVDAMYVKTVVSAYINDGFFSRKLFEKYSILTSHGIQTRYLQAVERRTAVKMAKEFLLLDAAELPKSVKITDIDVSAYINPSYCQHNADSNHDNADITSAEMPQSKVKNIYPLPPLRAGEEEQDHPETENNSNTDPALGRVVALYANNISPAYGPIEAEKLKALYDKYNGEWLEAAITEAVESSPRPNLKYIAAILERWQRDGFKTDRRDRNEHRFSKNARRNQGAQQESESTRKLKEDMRWADEHAVHPWDLPADAGGAGNP